MFLEATVSQIITFWIDRTGDAYISEWINAVFYISTFIAAIFKWKNLKRSQATYGEQYLWLFLIFVILVLGINKLGDFQSLLIESMRNIAKSGGWYGKSRLVQAWFAYALSGMVFIVIFIMLILLSTREFWRHNALSVIGFGILCFYTVVRTASTSHVGFVPDSASGGEFRLTDIIEFSGILCIFFNALTRYKTEGKEASKAETIEAPITERKEIPTAESEEVLITESYEASTVEDKVASQKKGRKKYRILLWGAPILIGIGMIVFFIFSYDEIKKMVMPYFSIGGRWTLEIGDSSPMGWFTVFSYYFTAGICFLKLFSRRVRQQKQEWTFWGIMCFIMVLLGVIKQFNLLMAVTNVLRLIASSVGWYDSRVIIQAWAMAIIAVLFSITIILALGKKTTIVRHSITLFGLAYLLLFVIFRGISWHAYEDLLGYEILGARVNWIGELLGIYWVCLSSLLKRT